MRYSLAVKPESLLSHALIIIWGARGALKQTRALRPALPESAAVWTSDLEFIFPEEMQETYCTRECDSTRWHCWRGICRSQGPNCRQTQHSEGSLEARILAPSSHGCHNYHPEKIILIELLCLKITSESSWEMIRAWQLDFYTWARARGENKITIAERQGSRELEGAILWKIAVMKLNDLALRSNFSQIITESCKLENKWSLGEKFLLRGNWFLQLLRWHGTRRQCVCSVAGDYHWLEVLYFTFTSHLNAHSWCQGCTIHRY